MVSENFKSSANSMVVFIVISGISLIKKYVVSGFPKWHTPDNTDFHVDDSSPTWKALACCNSNKILNVIALASYPISFQL